MSYKLTYFDIRARAETSRMLFALAEVDYEDKRVNKEEWQQLKPKSVFGQLPMLEVEGHEFCQSHAMERFLARRFGLYGKDEFEKTKADMIVDCVEDMFKPVGKVFLANTDEEKANARKECAQALTPQLDKLDGMVTSGGFFNGSEVTWPDLAMFNGLAFTKAMGVELDFSKCSKLNGLLEKVENNPKIAAWIKKRPENSM